MINNKKIEDAAKQHSEESYISGYFQACYKDAFMEGGYKKSSLRTYGILLMKCQMKTTK